MGLSMMEACISFPTPYDKPSLPSTHRKLMAGMIKKKYVREFFGQVCRALRPRTMANTWPLHAGFPQPKP
jgi:hypothetical protein